MVLGFAFIVMIANFSALAQEKRTLDKAKWEESKQTIDYTENNREKKPEKPEVENEEEQVSSRRYEGPDLSGVGYILIALVVVVLIIGIIILINQNNKSAAVKVTRRQATSMADAEDELPEVELTDLFQEQLDKGEWKLALRVKFLMILQDLIDKNLIVWQKQKTNQQFADEISDIQIKLKFKGIVIVFDQVWYGDEALSREEFDQVIFTLNKLHDQLSESQ